MTGSTLTVPRDMSIRDFALYGINEIAYVRPATTEDGRTVYAVHAPDGTALANAPTRALALALIVQNGMDPVNVH